MITVAVDGKTKIFAILGNPIAHTLSPAMHNAAFKALGLNCIYLPCLVEEDCLEDAVKGIRAIGIQGGNVTIPYKEKIIPFLDGITEEAKLIGAVNTYYWQGKKLWGTNTDGSGFLRALTRVEPKVKDLKSAVILGAGGSARAVAVSLALAGLKEINFVNRTEEKALALVDLLKTCGCQAQALTWQDIRLKEVIEESPLIIQTTPLGMVPNITECPPLPESWLTPKHLVVDLIYQPRETLFLKKAKQQGAKVMNGLGMLFEQGVLAFEYFSGCQAPVEVMAKELERWLK